jgi:diacylglycerol kinase (ATP)
VAPCCLIANPAAGRGGAARVVGVVRELLTARGVRDIRLSTHPGHERELAREAVASGVETIIALGGDGTWSNVARGIIDADGDARLALIAAGTGNDLAFGAGLRAHDAAAMVDAALGDSSRRIDVGRVDHVHFVNVAGFGIDPVVLEASRRVTWLRGHAVYLVTAMGKLFTYAGTHLSLTIDEGAQERRERMLALVVSNGPRLGGGFLIAPNASISDGALDIVTVRDANPLRRVALLWGTTRGTHVGAPEVRVRHARRARIDFDAPPLFDADGDLFQATSSSVEIAVLASRLRLAVPSR